MNNKNSYLFYIKIERLLVDCYIGWYDWEHEKPQPVYVTLECEYEADALVAQDNLASTLDYDGPKEVIIDILTKGKFKLLEAAAIHIKEALLEAYPKMQNLYITLEKPHAIPAAAAAIIRI
ncbi:MAG: dihydroneopterin aldolase [Alphaproteobacteria bacterium]